MRRLPFLPSWHLTQGIIGLLCLALSGQLLLQSFSLPHETPHAAIKRLINVDIAPTACPMALPEGTKTPLHSHHHNGDCALCPLLSHIFFAVSPEIIGPGILLLCHSSQRTPPTQPRTPLPSYYQRPPSRAPPFFT